MAAQDHVPAELCDKYEVREWRHACAILKGEFSVEWNDVCDVLRRFRLPDVDVRRGNRRCWFSDRDTFTSWPALSPRTRLVRSLETWTPRRQLDGQEEELTSDWMWVITLSARQAAIQAVVDMGHERWSIENQGFNELVNRWHANHVFRHHPTAMLIFVLFAMLCLNVLMAFYCRNLKPEARRAVTMLHLGKLISAELYAEFRGPPCISA